ncbi:MAG TPA: sigma-70 family RNA polymerase sigma factor [Thermoanaerobaculia bacterium]|nr:sigma-70 family RNA polymerase sigma factor [Thermoanaerobaculia bacterium]
MRASDVTRRLETDLASRIRTGDREAEAELVGRYQRGVTLLLRRSAGDPSLAEDLAQETFRIALEKIRRGDLREPEKLAGFLCSLARNLSIEHFRKASSQRTSGSPPEDSVRGDEPDPLERLLRAEQARIVRGILSELPTERDRQILLRFYLSEEDKSAICRDLGLTSLHFNRVLFRARERYRELFDERAKRVRRETR